MLTFAFWAFNFFKKFFPYISTHIITSLGQIRIPLRRLSLACVDSLNGSDIYRPCNDRATAAVNLKRYAHAH